MILIVGGAGYIGSHTNKALFQNNFKTLIYDNLIYGHREAVKWGDFILGDLNNTDQLKLVFSKNKINAVMHFSAFAYVGESVEHPEKYYINNVANTLNLLEVMREYKCKYLIFSSSCATYGHPNYLPIDEEHEQNPINPYGRSKLMVEHILRDYSKAYGLTYVSLRYFNAAGADLSCEIGENHNPETHLIPLVLDCALGVKDAISIFGNDYNTPDGTAIRDYLHVTDIANAHVLALKYLFNGGQSDIFNLGYGTGHSVLEVINTVRHITGIEPKTIFSPRRVGDPAHLVADSKKSKDILSWQPQYSDLETIITTAWEWHKCKKN